MLCSLPVLGDPYKAQCMWQVDITGVAHFVMQDTPSETPSYPIHLTESPALGGLTRCYTSILFVMYVQNFSPTGGILFLFKCKAWVLSTTGVSQHAQSSANPPSSTSGQWPTTSIKPT